MLRNSLTCFILAICACGAAQHMAPATDNFNTSHGLLYNPAVSADPVPYANIRLFGLSALLQNSYLFFPNGQLGASYGTKDDVAGSRQHLHLEADVYGPALTFAREYYSFGFFTRGRATVLGRNLTPEMVNFAINGLYYPPQHNKKYSAENTTIKHLGWGEIGFNYAQIIKRQGNQIITLGGNLKLLSAFSHITIRFDEIQYIVDTMNVGISTTTSRFGLSTPQVNLGIGAGIDVGIQFKKLLTDDNQFHIPHSIKRRCEIKHYKYKIGFSLIDLGAIPIKKNSSTFDFDSDTLFLGDYDNNKVSSISGLGRLLTKMSAVTGASPEVKEKLTAFLPASINAHFDYNFENSFYANATLMAGLRMPFFYGAERMSSLTLSARYERQRWCIAVPFTLYRYGPPALGLYLRLGPLQLGSNRPLPLLMRKDSYGADAYMSVTLPLYQSRLCQELIARKKRYCPQGEKRKLLLFKTWKKQRERRRKLKKEEWN